MQNFIKAAGLVTLAAGNEGRIDKEKVASLFFIDDANTSLSLDYYSMYYYDDANPFQFHGILNFEPTNKPEKYLEMGICIQIAAKDSKNWDCFTQQIELASKVN